MFRKVKNANDLEKLLKEYKPLFNKAKREITDTARGKFTFQEDLKEEFKPILDQQTKIDSNQEKRLKQIETQLEQQTKTLLPNISTALTNLPNNLAPLLGQAPAQQPIINIPQIGAVGQQQQQQQPKPFTGVSFNDIYNLAWIDLEPLLGDLEQTDKASFDLIKQANQILSKTEKNIASTEIRDIDARIHAGKFVIGLEKAPIIFSWDKLNGFNMIITTQNNGTLQFSTNSTDPKTRLTDGLFHAMFTTINKINSDFYNSITKQDYDNYLQILNATGGIKSNKGIYKKLENIDDYLNPKQQLPIQQALPKQALPKQAPPKQQAKKKRGRGIQNNEQYGGWLNIALPIISGLLPSLLKGDGVASDQVFDILSKNPLIHTDVLQQYHSLPQPQKGGFLFNILRNLPIIGGLFGGKKKKQEDDDDDQDGEGMKGGYAPYRAQNFYKMDGTGLYLAGTGIKSRYNKSLYGGWVNSNITEIEKLKPRLMKGDDKALNTMITILKTNPALTIPMIKKIESVDVKQDGGFIFNILKSLPIIGGLFGSGMYLPDGKGLYLPTGDNPIQAPKRRNQYKIQPVATSKNYSLGDLLIDGDQLGKGLLVARGNDGKICVKSKCDSSLYDLITKRYNTNKVYSDKAINTFKKLVQKSNHPMVKTSKKAALVDPTVQSVKVNFYNKPAQLIERLGVIIGSINAGNKSKLVFNEAVQIMDHLLNIKAISPSEHKQLFNQIKI